MSDGGKSAWEKVLDEISSPWDWVAGGLGAVLGLGVTIMVGGADLGASAAAGATGGVTARKALAASLRGWQLGRRANGLEAEITKRKSGNPALEELHKKLNRERDLWKSRAITNDEFAKQLDELVSEYRQIA